MHVDFAALLVGLAGLIAVLGGVWILRPPTRKWIVVVGFCAILVPLVVIAGVVGSSARPVAEAPELHPPTATTPHPPHSGANPGSPPATRPSTAQPGTGPCPTGDEVDLDFDRHSSGIAVPVTGTVECPAQTGRVYVLIVQRDSGGTPYYHPEQEIAGTAGEFHDSVSIVGSEPGSTRQIFVISVDRAELPRLRDTGPAGELANRLPASHRPASKKYPHTRTG